MENQSASPVPVPSFATGSRWSRKIDRALVPRFDTRVFDAPIFYAPVSHVVFFAPPIPKHPNHKADCQTYGNQPKCLLMNFNCHGGNTPFCPPARGIPRSPI